MLSSCFFLSRLELPRPKDFAKGWPAQFENLSVQLLTNAPAPGLGSLEEMPKEMSTFALDIGIPPFSDHRVRSRG